MAWSMIYRLDKGEYHPLGRGVLAVEVKNKLKSKSKIYVTKLLLKFDWMSEEEYYYSDVAVEIKPGDAKELPGLAFKVELRAGDGTHLFKPGLEYKELTEDGWSEAQTSFVEKGDHISIKQAPNRDFMVFFSHSNHPVDRPLIETCIKELERAGFTVYVAERNPLAGFPLWEKIRMMIDKCDGFLVLWTKNSSESGDVREEVGIAFGLQKSELIIPLGESGIEPKGSLRGLELIKISTQDPLTGLESAIRQLIGKSEEKKKGTPTMAEKTEGTS